MAIAKISVVSDPAAVADLGAQRVVEAAQAAIADHDSFSIALAGGSTPKAMYGLLASDKYRDGIDWTKMEIYFGDERCVPPDHPESNYRMASESLLSRVPIPAGDVHRMLGETDPREAAIEYGWLLKDRFGDGGLDMALLGMGEDGHTASLFPGTEAVNELRHRVVANYVEHSTTGKSWRITLTAPFLNRSKTVLLTVTGIAKAERLKEVLQGPRDPQRLPIQLIEPAGTQEWIVDQAAASLLTPANGV